MDKIRNILSPGAKADDEVMYGEENPNKLGKVSGEGSHFGGSRTTGGESTSRDIASNGSKMPTAMESSSAPEKKGAGSHIPSSQAAAPERKGDGSHFPSSQAPAPEHSTPAAESSSKPAAVGTSSMPEKGQGSHFPQSTEQSTPATSAPQEPSRTPMVSSQPKQSNDVTRGALTAASTAAGTSAPAMTSAHQNPAGANDTADTLDRSMPGAFDNDEQPVGTASTTGSGPGTSSAREHPTAGNATAGLTHNDPLAAGAAGAAGLGGYEAGKHHDHSYARPTGPAQPTSSGIGGTPEQHTARTDPALGSDAPAGTGTSMTSAPHPLGGTTKPEDAGGSTKPFANEPHGGMGTALGAGTAGAAGLGGAEAGKHAHEPTSSAADTRAQTQPTATTGVQGPVPTAERSAPHDTKPKDDHHYGRDAAVGAGAAGAGGVAAHELSKDKDDKAATTADDGTPKKEGPIDKLKSIFSRDKKDKADDDDVVDKDKHSHGKEAAGVGASVGAGAAGGLALEEERKHKEREAAEQAQKDADERARKEAEEAEKQHKKEVAEAEKEHKKAETQHEKEVAAVEKEHKKEEKKVEKEHDKAVKAAEKEHKKEEKAIEKEHEKVEKEAEKQQKHEAEAAAAAEAKRKAEAEKQQKEQAALIESQRREQEEMERKRHEKEAGAVAGGAAAVAGGVGAEEAYRHHEHDKAKHTPGPTDKHVADPKYTADRETTAPTTTGTAAGMAPEEAFRRQQQEKSDRAADAMAHEREREVIQRGSGSSVPAGEHDEGHEKKSKGGILGGLLGRKKDKDDDLEHDKTKNHGHAEEAGAAGAVGAAGAGAAYATHEHDKPTTTTGTQPSTYPTAGTAPTDSRAHPTAGATHDVGGHSAAASTAAPAMGAAQYGDHELNKGKAPEYAGTTDPSTRSAAHPTSTTHQQAPAATTTSPHLTEDKHYRHEAEGLGATSAAAGGAGLAAHGHGEHTTDTPENVNYNFNLGKVENDPKHQGTTQEYPEKSHKILGIIPTKDSKDVAQGDKHHTEEAAAATAGGAGTAAAAKHEHDKHADSHSSHHHDGTEKEKKPGLLDKLLHRHKDKSADEPNLGHEQDTQRPDAAGDQRGQIATVEPPPGHTIKSEDAALPGSSSADASGDGHNKLHKDPPPKVAEQLQHQI